MGIVRNAGPYHRLSRLYVSSGVTGLRAPIASTQYADLAAVSIGFWIYPTGTVASANRNILDAAGGNLQGAGLNGWGLQWQAGSPNRLRFYVPLTTQKRSESNTSVTALVGSWHYIIVRDSNVQGTAFSTVDFIFDGVVDAGGGGLSQNGVGAPTLGTARSLTLGNIGTASPAAGPPCALGPMSIWDHKVNDLVGLDLWNGASPLDFRKGLIGLWLMDGQEGSGFEPDMSAMGMPVCALPTTTNQSWWQGPPRVGRRPLRRVNYKAPAGGGVSVLPGVGALTLTGFAPTISVSNNQNVLAGVGALTLTGFAPTIAAPASVLPGVGALTLTGFAPSVAAGASVLPGVGALTLAGFAPTISVSNNQFVAPGVGALSLTGFVPTVATPRNVLPGAGLLSLTGFAPTVFTGVTMVVTPSCWFLADDIATRFAILDPSATMAITTLPTQFTPDDALPS